MENNYDVIIIGAGPNGLEAGAYLSRAGSKVLVLETRYESGGGLATEEVTYPGFLHNTHAIYMMMVDFAPVYTDFNLDAEYNCKHIHRSEEHTSELQSRLHLVCRLLLEKR